MHLPHDIGIALEALRGSERLVPDYLLHRVEELDPSFLKDLGYSHIIFDFDNTLTYWGGNSLPDTIQRLFESLINAGISILVASNGRSKRFAGLSRQWSSSGITFLGRCGKPKSDKIESFMEDSGWHRDTTILIGDNFGADVGAARTLGCSVALVTPRFWLEFPLTKIWRFVEWVHRLRRSKEWAAIPHLTREKKQTKRRTSLPFVLIMLCIIPVVVFQLPLARTPVPGSSLTAYNTAFMNSLPEGWSEPARFEPERSLLLAAITFSGTSLFGTEWVGPFSMVCIWTATSLLFIVIYRREGWLTASMASLIVLLSPAVLTAIGEVSSAPLELILILSILLIRGYPILSGTLFFLLMLNGLSGIVALPLLISKTLSSARKTLFYNICAAILSAATIWVIVIMSGDSAPLSWTVNALSSESTSYGSFPGDSYSIFSWLLRTEEALRVGLTGQDYPHTSLPILTFAIIIACFVSARKYSSISLYLGLRIASMLLFPALFFRALSLTLFLPLFIIIIASTIRYNASRIVPFIFALLLLIAIAMGVPDTRRHIVTRRLAYHMQKVAGTTKTIPAESRIGING